MNETKIVVDANVIAKWFISEEGSDKADVLKERYIDGEIEILTTPLLFYEVLNALKYSALFDESELNAAGESLENYGFKVITIQNEIRRIMIEIAVLHHMTIYDSSYIALSIVMDSLLCTADEKIPKKLPTKLKKHILILNEYS